MSSSTAVLDLLTVGQAGKEVTVNDAIQALSPALLYGRRNAFSVGLTWAYFGGRFNGVNVSNGTVTLTTNATNYVEADSTTGAVTSNTTGFAATGTQPLYVVVVNSAGVVTSYQDQRQAITASITLPYGIGGGTHTYGGGNYSLIVGGNGHNINAASIGGAILSGGTNVIGNANYCVIAGGGSNNASGGYAAILGGLSNVASGDYSQAGGYFGTTRGIRGAVCYGSGNFTLSAGVAQYGTYQMSNLTSSATPVVLTTAGAVTASTANQISMPAAASVYAVEGTVVARNTANNDAASWFIRALVKYSGSAASVVGTPTVTQLFADTGASAWAVSVAATTATRALTVTVTGAASTTIRWHSKFETVELA